MDLGIGVAPTNLLAGFMDKFSPFSKMPSANNNFDRSQSKVEGNDSKLLGSITEVIKAEAEEDVTELNNRATAEK